MHLLNSLMDCFILEIKHVAETEATYLGDWVIWRPRQQANKRNLGNEFKVRQKVH